MESRYDFERLNSLLLTVLGKNLSQSASAWLQDEGKAAHVGLAKFNIAFVAMPRKTGKNVIQISEDERAGIAKLRTDFTIEGWTTDRLSRAWLLMQLNPTPQESYIKAIENLFLNAEMSELVALYSSLPILAYQESWRKRCAEGIRNNIGQVLDAVICDNPYPAEQLDEDAWNQLVLKAIFTEKPVLRIVGLRKRRNLKLARSLSDYAHERWAAHRDVNPLLWICVAPFIDENNFSDIERLFSSGDSREREAAALACHESTYEPARLLLQENGGMKDNIEKGKISWEGIAERVV